MKFLAIALLAVCLIQGLSAQPQLAALRRVASSVSGAANNAVSAATNAAQTAASTAQNAATNAISNAQNAATNAISSAQSALSGLSANAENVINSATGSVNLKSIRDSLKNLSPEELLETITGAETLVNNAVEKVQSSVENVVNSASETAKAKIANATSSWNSDVAKVVNKAAAAGIDVSKCAVNSVTELGANVAEESTGCITKKIGEAAGLLNNIIKLPKRAVETTTAGVAAYRKCSAKSGAMKALCHATDTLPAAYNALVLVKDTVTYTTKSVTFVSTVQQEVAACTAKATATNALKAVSLSKNVVSCVKSELTAASA